MLFAKLRGKHNTAEVHLCTKKKKLPIAHVLNDQFESSLFTIIIFLSLEIKILSKYN